MRPTTWNGWRPKRASRTSSATATSPAARSAPRTASSSSRPHESAIGRNVFWTVWELNALRHGGGRVTVRGVAVVVDAYSTGSRLAPRFTAAGLPVVHVQSSPRLPDFYMRGFRAGDFVENVVHDGDLEATAARVAAHEPAFVVVGAEP